MLAVGDDLVLLVGGALEELSYAREGMMLLEVGEEAGLGDAEGTRGVVEDLLWLRRELTELRELRGGGECVGEGGFGLYGLGKDEVEDTEEEGAGLDGLGLESILIDGAVVVVLDVVEITVGGGKAPDH